MMHAPHHIIFVVLAYVAGVFLLVCHSPRAANAETGAGTKDDEGKSKCATFHLSNLTGTSPNETVVIEIKPEWAPLGAKRFEKLVESGFFNGTAFYRVVPGFVVQWGISYVSSRYIYTFIP